MLVTYLLNPGTAIYLGCTDNYANVQILPTTPPSIGLTHDADTSVGRQFFVKVSYLLRFEALMGEETPIPGRLPFRALSGFTLLLALGCAATHPAPPVPPTAAVPPAAAEQPFSYDVLNANLWQQTAEEYRASAFQAYAAARRGLDAALADPGWTAAVEQTGDFSQRPPAIILDVDETVLDNSPYASRQIKMRKRYEGESWAAWCEESAAPPVPGAVELTRYAAGRGVTVFYVTNRNASLQEATRENLRRQSFPLAADRETLFTRGSREEWKDSDKGPRRKFVADEFRVLLLVGDDLGDFLSGVKKTPAERQALAAPYASYWGSRWIVLPNPVYGSWEDALLGFERGLPEAELLRRKLEALRER